jgi:hypothetical protein
VVEVAAPRVQKKIGTQGVDALPDALSARLDSKRTASAAAKPKQKAEAADPRDLVPVRGLRSQNFQEIDTVEAEARFRRVVLERIAEREAKLGFRLEEDDIYDLVRVLRDRYCGPQGVIGPC